MHEVDRSKEQFKDVMGEEYKETLHKLFPSTASLHPLLARFDLLTVKSQKCILFFTLRIPPNSF